MPRNFKELREKMSPEAQARAHKKAEAMLETMSLHELRKAHRATQANVAASMRIGQGAVSKIEQRGTTNLQTLSRYVQALGGELELTARFGKKSIPLSVAAEE